MIIVCKSLLRPHHVDMPSNEEYIDLTLDKHYTALTDMFDSDRMVQIVDDTGNVYWYPKSNFIVLDSYREEKLNKLGI